jgi:predicted esterase
MRMRQAAALVAVVIAAIGAGSAQAASLYTGPGPKPGPPLLYRPLAVAPQLTNAGVWRAQPILVSGAGSYRAGEFVYQDFLYDDHGADGHVRDPGDPRASGDTFSAPAGTYTYPTDSVYAGNAADLVELRVRPLSDGSTAFRVTLDTLKDASRVATTIAIGSSATPRAFPHGANAKAPAALFLTVHGTTADLLDAASGAPVGATPPTVSVDTARRQIEVRVPRASWNPGSSVVRLAAGVGLWDTSASRYLVPGAAADATHPGGSGDLGTPPAFFNVAFRFAEPVPDFSSAASSVVKPAWWRDRAQADALRSGDLSSFHADVDFAKLRAGTNDDMAGKPGGVPQNGVLNRILASHFETAQGTDYSTTCGQAASCKGELRGQLQPYAVYVPRKARPAAGWGLTLLLHSLGANYNQFSGSRNQSQFGERGGGSLVITPAGRGPDGWYYDYAGADTWEAWADVAAHYRLDPDWTSIAGYSMGGYGTYKFATQFPDLFAKAQPTVGPPGLGIWVPPAPPTGGASTNTNPMLPSVRNIPFLIWAASSDELVPVAGTQAQARTFDDLGYRYEFDLFQPADHLTLAANDQFAPAAAFLGTDRVNRNPAHVTYVYNPKMDFAALGTQSGHAYWVSDVALRNGTGDNPLGTVDVRSQAFGAGDPVPGPTTAGAGTLTGGNFPALAYVSQTKTWGPAPPALARDRLDIRATNVSSVTIDAKRARISCKAQLSVTTDGPLTVKLAGCNQSRQFG